MGSGEGKENGDQMKKVVPIPTGNFQDVSVLHEQKMQEFEEIMGKILGQALRENGQVLGEEVGDRVSLKVIREIGEKLRLQEEREEKRFQNLDHAIREHQKAEKECAAAVMPLHRRTAGKKKSRFFKKRKRRVI